MTPQQLLNAAYQIQQRWPDALIYPNPPQASNGYVRHPALPANALAVDVDQVWPHECDDDDECMLCCGFYRLVAWIDCLGAVHWVSPAVDNLTSIN